jgi:hypothetical protein
MGDADRARTLMDDLAREGFDSILRTIRWNGTITEVGMLAAEIESAESAKELLDLLATARDQHGLLPMPINYSGPLTRPMAGLSCVLGLADEALELYDEAYDAALALRARPTMARIGLEAAQILARSGDRTGARERLADSEAIAREVGMPRVVEDAKKILGRL